MQSPNQDPISQAKQLMARKQEFAALDILRNAIKQNLNLGDRWQEVLQLCEQLGDEDAAAEAARNFGASDLNDPRRPLIYVDKLSRVGATGQAAEIIKELAARRPNDPAVLYMRGQLEARLGEFDHAEASLRSALRLKPDLADAWVQIGAFRNLGEIKHDLEAIRRLAETSDGFVKIASHYALGEAYENCGDYETAFKTWDLANSLLLEKRPFDPRKLARMKVACSDFKHEFSSMKLQESEPGPVPIFIVGAPRTGTTLLEHILSFDPAVHSLGESLISRVATWPVRHLSPNDLSAAEKAIGPRLWELMGGAYQTLARNRTSSAAFVTDKAAMLHLFTGVLAKSLPQARFIWIRRQAEAAEIPRLSEFVGLSAQSDLSKFYQSDRAIDTASLAQVRQPIDRKRANAWRVYETLIRARL